MSDILDFFPIEVPREGQIKALNFLQARVNDGFRDIVLAAPTGTGKSGIGVAAAYWFANQTPADHYQAGAYYLVTQKLLQDQLARELGSYKIGCNNGQLIKSADDYLCPEQKNCGVGRRLKKGCSLSEHGACTYQVQKNRFLGAPLGVTNYAYFFAERQYAGKLVNRSCVVADECHNLAEEITRFVDALVTDENCHAWTNLGRTPALITLADYVKWLEDEYLPQIEELNEMLIAMTGATDAQSKQMRELDGHMCKLHRAVPYMKEDPKNWVFWRETSLEGKSSLIARPISASAFADELFRQSATVRLYLSAYPGVKDVFCRELGLREDEVAWASLGSNFPVENRRVFAMGFASMASSTKVEAAPVISRVIVKLAKNHPDRGLIHCVSYELGDKIANALRAAGMGSRVVFPKTADEREAAFKQHSDFDGSILISPSMMEGFDFAGDLARWCVIAKVPYLYLGDKQVEAKMIQDPAWYQMKAVMKVIQASGRVCRSETDTGVTYILDSDFDKLYKKAEDMFPNWWKRAVQFANTR